MENKEIRKTETPEQKEKSINELIREMSENRRQRMSDDLLIYDIITQQIEALSEACEMSELTKDIPQLVSCAKALTELVTARVEHIREMNRIE